MSKEYLFGFAYLFIAILGPSGGAEEEDCGCEDRRVPEKQKKDDSCSGCGCGKTVKKERESRRDYKVPPRRFAAMKVQKPAPVKATVMREGYRPMLPQESRRSYYVLKIVRVRRGWHTKKYVDHTKGANLQATVLCNGWPWPLKRNPVLQPGQRLKLCSWK